MDKPNCAIAVLAAGSGSRFGGGKLDSQCAGKPLGCWITDAAKQAGFSRCLIVVGQVPPLFATALSQWETVVNPSPADGLSSSVACAAKAAMESERLVIALADMPLVDTAHLIRLRDASGITFTAYPDSGRGVPAAFPQDVLPTLARLGGRARQVRWPQPVSVLDPQAEQMLIDVDTPGDLNLVEELLRQR